MRIVLSWLCVAAVAAAVSAEEKKPAVPAKAPAPSAASAPAPAAEALHPVAGTDVSLAVPAGFNASTDFPGIGRAADLSSVMVTALDVPLAIASDAFSPDAMARRDIAVESTTPLVVDGRQTTLITATQKIGSMAFRKWFVLLGNDTRSVLLTATTPVKLEAQHRDALLHVLESARWTEAGKPAAAPAALSFQVKEAAPLRIVRSGADSIVLSDPQAVKGHVPPLVAVGVSQAHVDVGDLPTFAKTRLDETVSIHDIAVETQGPRTLGSLEGYEIAATAVDAESQRPVRVQQILASDGARYYLVQGIFDAEDAKQLAPAFEAVASSFALRNSSATSPPR
jgi:hypothetical protein